jgi:hypothetical protein
VVELVVGVCGDVPGGQEEERGDAEGTDGLVLLFLFFWGGGEEKGGKGGGRNEFTCASRPSVGRPGLFYPWPSCLCVKSERNEHTTTIPLEVQSKLRIASEEYGTWRMAHGTHLEAAVSVGVVLVGREG